MNRNLLKQYAIKGAKCGGMVSLFVCFPMACYHSGRGDRLESVGNRYALKATVDAVAVGGLGIISPVVGAIGGLTYIACKSYGFNDVVWKYKKMILFPVGSYALCCVAYRFGWHYKRGR